MELVYLILILIGVLYFNKVIKKSTEVVANNLDIALDMSTDEMSQVRADQIIRHARNDARRTEKLEEVTKEGSLTANQIIKMRLEGKL